MLQLANRPEGRGFSTLLGWAFRPRNFMKNLARHGGFPDVRGGFSPLSFPRQNRPQKNDGLFYLGQDISDSEQHLGYDRGGAALRFFSPILLTLKAVEVDGLAAFPL
jgi:hypothetical protein